MDLDFDSAMELYGNFLGKLAGDVPNVYVEQYVDPVAAQARIVDQQKSL